MSRPRPWTLLVNGVPAPTTERRLRLARFGAIYVSSCEPYPSTAIVRLGLPHTLIRFERGREVRS